MTTLYVAGASAEIERCEAFRDACKAMGYVVTVDWCAMVRSVGAANGGLADDQRRAAKALAYEGASTCDVFVLLLPGGYMTTRGARFNATIGAWCELGHSEATRHNVTWGYPSREFLVVGDSPERTVFAVDLPHYATDADALRHLAEMIGLEASSVKAEAETGAQIVDLFEALKKSLEGSRG